MYQSIRSLYNVPLAKQAALFISHTKVLYFLKKPLDLGQTIVSVIKTSLGTL